jgi:hypothetical protein
LVRPDRSRPHLGLTIAAIILWLRCLAGQDLEVADGLPAAWVVAGPEARPRRGGCVDGLPVGR